MICACDNCSLKTIFFYSFKGKELEYYCNSRVEVKYSAKDIIIKQDSQINDFLYLKEGLVKLYRTDNNGESQIISFGKPMEFVSIQSVFSEKTYNYSVQALEDSVVCVLNFNSIDSLVRKNGDFAISLLKQMGNASDRIIINTLDLLRKRLMGRVAHVLIYFADNVYNNNEYDLPISRKEMAQYIGMSVENVIRTISELKKDKIIKVYGKTINIVEKERLKIISERG